MRAAIVGPVYPYRAGIAYCTTRLAQELGADVISFSRQFPRRFYPGGDDIDPTLPRADAAFIVDVLNPLTWIRAGRRLRPYDSVIFVWWVWVWAVPYLTMMAMLRRGTKVILQCHNVGEKEPAWWKSFLTNRVLRRADVRVVHALSELEEVTRRIPGGHHVRTHLPVHELGGVAPSREEARRLLGIKVPNVALFFGHVRPFKALDVVLRAWPKLQSDVLLLVAGEAWWKGEEGYRRLAAELGLGPRSTDEDVGAPLSSRVRFEFRFIPDAEIATYFAAADVVLAPYRIEAQSGVALTAFHFARPVIATNVGGLPEIVQEGKSGFIVPPDDPEALARAIDRFFREADRAAMERGAAEMARQLSWPEYAKVFRGLLTGQ